MPACGRTIRLPESIEDIRQEFRINAHPGIGDGNLDLAIGPAQLCLDTTSLVCELDCIPEQVPDHLLQAVGIAEDGATALVADYVESNSLRFGAGPDDINGGLKDPRDLEGVGVELETSRDDARGIQDVVDQPGLGPRALLDHLEGVWCLRFREPAMGEHVRPAQDRS